MIIGSTHSRILICRSNPVAPDPRVEKIANSLSRAGYSVQVVGWDRTGKLALSENKAGVGIFRLPILADYGQGMGNLPQLLRWQWGLVKWLVSHRDSYDVIHACDFDTILPAIFSMRIFKKKVIYDIFDFYADHLRKTPGWIKKLIRQADIASINHADGVIIVDDARLEQIKPACPRRLEVIYNSPEDILPNPKYQLEEPSSFAGLRIAYVGLMQVERGLREFLGVLEKHPDWILDLAGFGGDQELLLNQARSLQNVTWHGRVPYDLAIEISQKADVLFATYDPSIANHRYSSPNKVFEAMMLAKPLIVARDTNVDRIVEKYRCGIVVPYGDTAALENALSQLAANADLRREYGNNARAAYEQVFGWDRMRDKLVNLYRQIG